MISNEFEEALNNLRNRKIDKESVGWFFQESRQARIFDGTTKVGTQIVLPRLYNKQTQIKKKLSEEELVFYRLTDIDSEIRINVSTYLAKQIRDDIDAEIFKALSIINPINTQS